MSSDDNLDLGLFWIPTVESEAFSFGEFEYPGTRRCAPQTPLSLPLYTDPPISGDHPIASSSNWDAPAGYASFASESGVHSKIHFDLHGSQRTQPPRLGITQTSKPDTPSDVSSIAVLSHNPINRFSRVDNALSNTKAGSTRPDDSSNSLKLPPTQILVNHSVSSVDQSEDYGSGSQQSVPQNAYLNVKQSSTSLSSARASAAWSHYPLPYGAEGLNAIRTRQTALPLTSASHYPLPYEPKIINKENSLPLATSSSPYPSPHGLKKPESHRTSTSTLFPNDTPRLKTTKSRKTARASSLLPDPSSSISGSGYNAPIDLTDPINKGQSSASFEYLSSYDAAGLNTSDYLTRGQLSAASSLHNALGSAGVNTLGSPYKAQSPTLSVDNPLPSNSSARYSLLDWDALYVDLGLSWDDPDPNVNAGFIDTNVDASIPSHPQPTNHDSYYSTQPQDHASNQDFYSQDIAQGSFTNVAQPSAFSAQDPSASNTNENALVPSHAQSAKYDVFCATQPHYGYNQDSGVQNTACQKMFIHETQPPTPSLQTIARQYKAFPVTQPSTSSQSQNGPELCPNSSFECDPAFSGLLNVPNNNSINSSTSDAVIPSILQNAVLESDVNVSLYNRDVQGMHANLIVNRSGVAYNQRSIVSPNEISTTRYNAYATVPNVEVPPTSGVPSVDMVNRKILYPTPPPYTVLAQGGYHYLYPPFNSPTANIPVPTFPASTLQPDPMQTNTHTLSQPMCMLPTPPNSDELSNSISPPPTFSASATSTRTKRKRNNGDDNSANNGRRTKRREGLRPNEHLYEKTTLGEFRCLYVGPAQPQGCTQTPLATLQSLSRHIRTQHAKREVNMDILPEQRVAFNGLPPSLRTVLASCPLDQADLIQCKYSRENGGQRWRIRTMDTAEQAIGHHIKSDHNLE